MYFNANKRTAKKRWTIFTLDDTPENSWRDFLSEGAHRAEHRNDKVFFIKMGLRSKVKIYQGPVCEHEIEYTRTHGELGCNKISLKSQGVGGGYNTTSLSKYLN